MLGTVHLQLRDVLRSRVEHRAHPASTGRGGRSWGGPGPEKRQSA